MIGTAIPARSNRDRRNEAGRQELPPLALVLEGLRKIGRPAAKGEIARVIGRGANAVGQVCDRSTASILQTCHDDSGHRWLVEPRPAIRQHWPEWGKK